MTGYDARMPTRLAFVPRRVNGHVITDRERQVQRLLLGGRTPGAIARLAGLSRERTHELIGSLRRKGLRPTARRMSATPARRGRSAGVSRGPAQATNGETGLDPKTRARFGAHLRQLRTARGLTQAQLADGAFTAAFVSMVESGRSAPSLKSLIHFASRLEIAVREVVPPDL